MAELEEELIGDDLDYEYDLDEEEEEALLAGDVPSHGVDVEDIIEFKVDDEFGGEEDGGQMSHSKSVHSRLHGGPNRLQGSARLQGPNTVYEDDDLQNRIQTSGRLQPPSNIYEEEEIHQNRLQSSGRLKPPDTVYEDVQQNTLQSSGRLQPPNTVYEEEEIHETYDSSLNNEPVPVHGTQNIIEEEEEEEEEEDDEEDDGRGRDRFKSERCKTSLVNTTIKRIIPDSLDQVQVKDQINMRDMRGGRGRGRGGPHPQMRGAMRGGQRGGRGGMMPLYGWPGPGPRSPNWQNAQLNPMMNPANRMNLPGNNMSHGRGLHNMNRPNLYSLFGRGSHSQGQNHGNFPFMANLPWNPNVGPFSGPSILSHLLPRPQIPPPDDMRNMLMKKRSMNDGMQGSPVKQMKVNQGPLDNQHQQQSSPQQHNQQSQPQKQQQQQQKQQQQQQQHQQKQQQQQQQQGEMGKKIPLASRLCIPARVAQTPSSGNPNLTTIQTVDVLTVTENQEPKPQEQNQGPKPQQQNQGPVHQQNQNTTSEQQQVQKPPQGNLQPQKTAIQNNRPLKGPISPQQQNNSTLPQVEASKLVTKKPETEQSRVQSKETTCPVEEQQSQGSTDQSSQNNDTKTVPEVPQVSLTPEEMEYQKKLEQQKKLREEMLAKKEARRKAAAQVKVNEMAKKKAEEEKTKPVVSETSNTASAPKQMNLQKDNPAIIKVPQNQQNNVTAKPKPKIPPNQQQKQGFMKMTPIQNQVGPRPQINSSQQFHGGMDPNQNRGQLPSRYDNLPHSQQQNMVPRFGQPQHPQIPYFPPSQDRPPPTQGPPPQNMPPPHHQAPPSQHPMPHSHPLPVTAHPRPNTSLPPQGPPHGPPHGPPQLLPQRHPSADVNLMPPIQPVQRPPHSIMNAPRPSPHAILGPPPELPHRPLIDPRDSYPPHSDYYSSSRAPLPSQDYPASYSDSNRSSWSDYPQSHDSYRDNYNDRDDYYRREPRDSYQDQRYEDKYRYDPYGREYDDHYRDKYYRDSYAYDQYREGEYRYPQEEPVYPDDRGMKQPTGGPIAENPHHIQVKLVENLPKPPVSNVHTQVGQKIQTIQRHPVTNVRKTLYRRITRKNVKGEIISVKKIPVDENGQQIGEPITEYQKSDGLENQQSIPVVSHQQVQEHVPVMKTVRQIVKKVPITHQYEDQEPRVQVFNQNKRQQLQQGQQSIKLVKRTVISAGENISPIKQVTRRVISAAPQPSTSGNVIQSLGRRRIIAAKESVEGTDLPTVRLWDLPRNLHLTDINKMVAGSGVEAPLKVSYVPGSGECFISFRSAEIAARFYQKFNRRMVNMSVIKANMLC